MARRPKTPCPNCIHGVKRCGRHQRPSNPHAPTRLRLASEKAAEPEAKNQSRATSAKRESVLRNSELSAPLIRQTILPRTTSPVHHRTTLMMMMTPTPHLQSALVLAKKLILLRKRQLLVKTTFQHRLLIPGATCYWI
jgi:hypothetical protein